MLVLSRTVDQEIVIDVPASKEGTRVIVKVADIRGSKVRIGLSAHDSVKVLRAELDTAKESQ